MNAKRFAPNLRRQGIIAEVTETDIDRAKDSETANEILYDHLHKDCTSDQILLLSRVLMDVDAGFGNTRQLGKLLSTSFHGQGPPDAGG